MIVAKGPSDWTLDTKNRVNRGLRSMERDDSHDEAVKGCRRNEHGAAPEAGQAYLEPAGSQQAGRPWDRYGCSDLERKRRMSCNRTGPKERHEDDSAGLRPQNENSGCQSHSGTNLVSKNIITIFAQFLNDEVMIVISSRDFRYNQSKYLGLAANGQGVVLTTRNLGSFKIVPITEEDTLITKEQLYKKIDKGIQEIKEGKGYRVGSKEELERFLDSL